MRRNKLGEYGMKAGRVYHNILLESLRETVRNGPRQIHLEEEAREEIERQPYDAIVNNGSHKISRAEADKFCSDNIASSFSDWLKKKIRELLCGRQD